MRGPDSAAVLRAARRFQASSAWAGHTVEEIAGIRERIRRKHALAVVAKEAGFQDWPHLKNTLTTRFETGFDETRLFEERTGGFMNLWFRDYEEARKVLEKEPAHYLFPYRQYFVVFESSFLAALDVNTGDSDWDRIGHDWVQPADTAARSRLSVHLRQLVGEAMSAEVRKGSI